MRRLSHDVFPEEPFTDHPIFEREDVVVTPHLGASTDEAQDRAGVVTAEQVTDYCREHLAAYKYPRIVEFAETLPKGPTGKILKRELRS